MSKVEWYIPEASAEVNGFAFSIKDWGDWGGGYEAIVDGPNDKRIVKKFPSLNAAMEWCEEQARRDA
jgi:hypothetical protein